MSKVKSEATRQHILDAATQVFQQNGFDGTTMDAIRDASQVSKATLYNYFSSKAELFVEILLRKAEASFNNEMVELENDFAHLKENLQKLTFNMIFNAYSPNGLAIRRLVIADNKHKNLGKMCYERGPKKGKALMISVLQKAMNLGYLKQTDARIAECHLRALVEAEFVEILHFGLEIPLTIEWINSANVRAIETFFKIYQVE